MILWCLSLVCHSWATKQPSPCCGFSPTKKNNRVTFGELNVYGTLNLAREVEQVEPIQQVTAKDRLQKSHSENLLQGPEGDRRAFGRGVLAKRARGKSSLADSLETQRAATSRRCTAPGPPKECFFFFLVA